MTEASGVGPEPLPAEDTAAPGPARDPSGAPPIATPTPGLPPTAATARIFGALLWAYVVLGEWVVGLSFPEPLAILIVATVLGGAWFTSVGHGPATPALHRTLPGLFAVTLWVLLLMLSSTLPSRTDPSRVEAVSASLCIIGAAAFYAANPWHPAPVSARIFGRRRVRWLARTVAAAATLLAIASALSRI